LEGRRFLIHDPELFDSVIKGLARQAVYQIRRIKALGFRPILFIDEPSLSGYGSGFSPISPTEVITALGQTIDIIREAGEVLIGLHCCGNTDWSLLLSLDLDLINLDAFEFGQTFLLYPKDIRRFLEEDRAIAWGIVPTAAYTGQEGPDFLLDRLSLLFSTLLEHGLDQERLLTQAVLTPSCGMGLLSVETARKLLDLLSRVCRMARERFL
jgi:methionine synthase II (cobalamin-independent)